MVTGEKWSTGLVQQQKVTTQFRVLPADDSGIVRSDGGLQWIEPASKMTLSRTDILGSRYVGMRAHGRVVPSKFLGEEIDDDANLGVESTILYFFLRSLDRLATQPWNVLALA